MISSSSVLTIMISSSSVLTVIPAIGIAVNGNLHQKRCEQLRQQHDLLYIGVKVMVHKSVYVYILLHINLQDEYKATLVSYKLLVHDMSKLRTN